MPEKVRYPDVPALHKLFDCIGKPGGFDVNVVALQDVVPTGFTHFDQN